ncbi:hypothetical protein Ddc_19048 [Ditylenchus destructor]|nr:hypothetical protein Ddc_19048 [Ditylenchus destructor]
MFFLPWCLRCPEVTTTAYIHPKGPMRASLASSGARAQQDGRRCELMHGAGRSDRHRHFRREDDAPAGDPDHEASQVGRLALNKRFHGDLEGTSLGGMLAFRTEVAGSAGYVAMERVEGKLAGREGSFVLMHTGEMNRGQPSLVVQVVPDSGTGELQGLSGRLSIDVRGGRIFMSWCMSSTPQMAGEGRGDRTIKSSLIVDRAGALS